jgi:nitrogen fixation protein FixH
MAIDEYVAGGRPLTGRRVLLMLLGFFGCIAIANFALVHYALSTFRGEVEDHPYEAGIAFNQEIATAQAQEQLHWNVSGVVSRVDAERLKLEIVAHEAQGEAIGGLAFSARLQAPADKAKDRSMDLTEIAPGVYRGITLASGGAWDLIIEAMRDGKRIYRSKSRITVE